EDAKEIGRLEGHSAWVTSIAYSSDGARLLSASDDKTARLWDVATHKPVQTFAGHTGCVKCAALSADGKRVLTGAADQTVRLWGVESGKEIKRLEQHADSLVGVAFNDGGKESLSASRDSGVRIWKLLKAAQTPPAGKEAPAPQAIRAEIPVEPGEEITAVQVVKPNPEKDDTIGYITVGGHEVRVSMRTKII